MAEHRRNPSHRWLLAAVAVTAVVGAPARAVQDDPAARRVSVTELASDPALVGRRLVVRGRFDCLVGRLLRLKQCEVDFLLEPDWPFRSGTQPNIELEGILERQEEGLVFRVERLRPAPSDESEFARRCAAALRAGDANAWYEVADWARGEGELYDDGRLLAWAAEAAREGIRLEERSAIEAQDGERLFALGDRAEQLGLSGDDVERIRFEAFCLRWARLDRADADGLDRFAADLALTLPGCDEPPAAGRDHDAVPRLGALFERYSEADVAQRRAWHRELWASAVEAGLRLRVKEDETGGFRSARLAALLIPERPALAGEFRDRALAGRAAQVAELDRSQVVDLVERYHEAGRKEDGDRLFRAWLEAQFLDPGTADEHLALARDFLALGERAPAAALLLGAWEMRPGSAELAAELESLGYRLTRQGWIAPDAAEAADAAAGDTERGIGAGRIEAGMTAAQVLRALSPPDRVVRIVTRDVVTEQWLYDSSPAYCIVFTGPVAGSSDDMLRVVAYFVRR